MFLRMLFSVLVDTDFLDTEGHFDNERSSQRVGNPSVAELWKRFEQDQTQLTGLRSDCLNQIRNEIYDCCLVAANKRQGFFRLTVPAGGGKTRSGMGFALQHALHHNLDRVIVAIPYTSIIEQTAEVQTLPLGMLEPILDVLRQLVENYGATVVLSTATQPALTDGPYLRGLPEPFRLPRSSPALPHD